MLGERERVVSAGEPFAFVTPDDLSMLACIASKRFGAEGEMRAEEWRLVSVDGAPHARVGLSCGEGGAAAGAGEPS